MTDALNGASPTANFAWVGSKDRQIPYIQWQNALKRDICEFLLAPRTLRYWNDVPALVSGRDSHQTQLAAICTWTHGEEGREEGAGAALGSPSQWQHPASLLQVLRCSHSFGGIFLKYSRSLKRNWRHVTRESLKSILLISTFILTPLFPTLLSITPSVT